MASTSSAATLYLRSYATSGAMAGTTSEAVLFVPVRSLAGLYSRGTIATRDKKRWKPSSLVPMVDPQSGRIEPAWDQFLDDLANRKLGGPNASTLPQVEASITYSEAQSLIAQGIAAAMTQWIRANAQVVQSIKEVIQASPTPLAGAFQIPPVQLDPAEPPEVFLRDKNGTIL